MKIQTKVLIMLSLFLISNAIFSQKDNLISADDSGYKDFVCTDLVLNTMSEGVCVDGNTYMFGWAVDNSIGVAQSAFQIQVSDQLSFKKDDLLFDTQKIDSTLSQNIRFTINLPQGEMCYWRVRIWDDMGNKSTWSDAYTFFTTPNWQAHWISTRAHTVSSERRAMPTFKQKGYTNPEDSCAVYMGTELLLQKNIESAHIYFVGLGYADLEINGTKISSHVLNPAFTDYQKRVSYNAYNVTEYLRKGENALQVTLGNGFYNLYTQNLFMIDQAQWKTPHKLLLQLHVNYSDGTEKVFETDKSWKWGKGPIVFNSLMGGETFDARNEVDLSKNVVLSEGPGGLLVPQQIPAMEVNQRISAKLVTCLSEKTFLVDFGENITGAVELNIPETTSGTNINIYYNEVLDKDGHLKKNHSTTHTRGRFQHDIYITDGKAGTFKNHFSYFGFRYVQIENYPDELFAEDIVATSIHNPMLNEGYFECSNQRVNQLQAAIKRTLRNSIHGMPGEEPTREKMGWTFDAGVNCMESYLYNYMTIAAYHKYLNDLVDAQEPGGHIPPIVPTNGWGFLDSKTGKPILYDDPWWGGTILYVMDKLVQWTGDPFFYDEYYNGLKKYTEYVLATADEEYVVHWSLGDWLDPYFKQHGWGPGLTSIKLTSTLGLYDLLAGTARIARKIGKNEDAIIYADRAQKVKHAFVEKLYNEENYKPLSQTAHALPLWVDALDSAKSEMAYSRLKNAISKVDNHIYSGFIGVKPVLDALAQNGDKQMAFDMILQEESPGWLHMVSDEFSTMGENMNKEGYGTGHHPFGTNISYWFYQNILGIEPLNGWPNFTVRPFLPEQLSYAKGAVDTPYGLCRVSIDTDGENLHYEIEVPFNTSCLFYPSGTLIERNQYKLENGVLLLQSGKHTFSTKKNNL